MYQLEVGEGEREHPGKGSHRWKGTEEYRSIGVKDSAPSTWRERRHMANVTMTQIPTTSLDAKAICSPHHVDLPSLKFPEAIRTNNVSNE